MSAYIFTSNRLGFRNWEDKDLPLFIAINQDPKVMAHFPKSLSPEATKAFIEKSIKQYHERGYTYFAVDLLETEVFIGFIGLSFQTYEASFNPSVDIGWRLDKKHWGKGLATEGAKRCLEFAFSTCNLDSVYAVCTVSNVASERVMEKIGLEKQGYFEHPLLLDFATLKDCVHYQLRAERFYDLE